MHHSLKTMPTHGYLPYQGWALLNFPHYFSLRNIAEHYSPAGSTIAFSSFERYLLNKQSLKTF